MWAAGNGGLNDNCNGDGYVNSIYTVPITSVGADGRAAYYAEVCAPVFAATYSGNRNTTLVSYASIQNKFNTSSSFNLTVVFKEYRFFSFFKENVKFKEYIINTPIILTKGVLF